MFFFLFSSLLWAEDLDADGYESTIDCDDNNINVFPGATEICDGFDNNCNGLTDEALTITYWPDTDQDGYGDPSTPTPSCTEPEGYVNNNQDCDDANDSIFPNADEICDDGIDNNCNFMIDENCGQEPATEPAEEPAQEPTAEPSAPTTEPAEEPAAEPAEEPASEPSSPNSGRPVDLKDDEGCAGSFLWLLCLFPLRKRRAS